MELSAVGASYDPGSSDAPRARNVKDAAQQFEALLLGQILKSAHTESDTQDQTSSTIREIADEHLARALATQGGLGLARMVTQNLDRQP